MQRSKFALLALIMVAAVTMTSTSLAFAQNEGDIEIGISLGEQGIGNAVTGGTAGVLLSTIAVLAKHIRNEAGKKPDPKQYGLNIVIGAISALVVGFIPGIGNVFGGESISFAVAFVLLYVVDQIVRPIWGNWAKGDKASSNGKKDK